MNKYIDLDIIDIVLLAIRGSLKASVFVYHSGSCRFEEYCNYRGDDLHMMIDMGTKEAPVWMFAYCIFEDKQPKLINVEVWVKRDTFDIFTSNSRADFISLREAINAA